MSNLQPQAPAQGVLVHKDFGDSIYYSVLCSCGNERDTLMFNVEADECNTTLHIYNKVETEWWNDTWRKRYDIDNKFLQDLHWLGLDFINGLWRRIKLTWKLWTKGYLEYESWTLLDRQQTINLAHTLIKAVDDVEKFRADRVKKDVT